jgi:hypothetical protein
MPQKWIAGAQAFSSGNLADNTAMASRANGYYAIAQVSAADVVIDNAANRDLFLAITINLGSWTPTVTDYIELYLLYAADGTNYETGSTTYLPPADSLWGFRDLSTNTTAAAKRVTLWRPIRPFRTKVLWRWMGTNNTAASANSMSWQTFNTDPAAA